MSSKPQSLSLKKRKTQVAARPAPKREGVKRDWTWATRHVDPVPLFAPQVWGSIMAH